MRKQKLFVCMLSTSLLIPSFPLNQTDAETADKISAPADSTNVTKDQAKSASNHSNEKQDETSATQNKSKQATQKTSKNDDKAASKLKQSDADQAQSDQTLSHDDAKSAYEQHTLDFFKPKSTYTPFHNQGFFSRLFNTHTNTTDETSQAQQSSKPSSDTHNNETSFMTHDSTESSASSTQTNASKINQSQTQQEAHQTQTSTPQTKQETNQTQSDTSQTQQPSNDSTDQAIPHQSNDNDIFKQLDEASSNATNSQQTEPAKPNDSSQHEQVPDNGASKQSTTTKEPSTSNADDRVVESILDQYSEDAKQSKADYDAQKTGSTQHKSTQTPKQDKQLDTNQNNPQMPSQSQLEHKQKPAQSFDSNATRSDMRTTATFQLLPNLSGEDTSTNDYAVSENKATRDFIKSIAKDAHAIGQKDDIYASVMIAQAILESDSGNSRLARAPHYNLFGIKGAYQGQSATYNTLEDSGSGMYQISAAFRSYPSETESLEDYADLMKHGIDGNPTIYQPAWKSEALSYRSATRHLATTYATDTRYADKLNSLIKHYDLTQFDHKTMPNLSHYKPSNTSSGDFKPFAETTGNSPYPHGQCTWYVYNRMAQFNQSISGDLGDARNWNNRAERKEYPVTSTPKAHTAVVFEAGQQGADSMYGHVAFVEKVNSDGSIVISESNVKGLGVISYRTIDAQDASELSYIEGQQQ